MCIACPSAFDRVALFPSISVCYSLDSYLSLSLSLPSIYDNHHVVALSHKTCRNSSWWSSWVALLRVARVLNIFFFFNFNSFAKRFDLWFFWHLLFAHLQLVSLATHFRVAFGFQFVCASPYISPIYHVKHLSSACLYYSPFPLPLPPYRFEHKHTLERTYQKQNKRQAEANAIVRPSLQNSRGHISNFCLHRMSCFSCWSISPLPSGICFFSSIFFLQTIRDRQDLHLRAL